MREAWLGLHERSVTRGSACLHDRGSMLTRDLSAEFAMVTLRMTVRNAELSPEARADIRQRVERLRHYYDRITNCRVTIEVPQRRRRTDRKLYGVRLALTVPLGSIAIDRQPRRTLET